MGPDEELPTTAGTPAPTTSADALDHAARNLHRAEACVGMDAAERLTAIADGWINIAALLQTGDEGVT